MGERIRATIEIIQELRRGEQKYSFEHFVANVLLGLAALVLTLLGEHKLWATLMAVLAVSLGVQGFRAWRYIRRQDREHEERLRQAMRGDADG